MPVLKLQCAQTRLCRGMAWRGSRPRLHRQLELFTDKPDRRSVARRSNFTVFLRVLSQERGAECGACVFKPAFPVLPLNKRQYATHALQVQSHYAHRFHAPLHQTETSLTHPMTQPQLLESA